MSNTNQPVWKLIVSRHPALVEWLKSIGPEWADAEVETGNVSTDRIAGREVAGPLPLHLIARTARYWAVEFAGAPPRGTEYGVAEMEEAGARLVEYRVQAVPVQAVEVEEVEWSNRQGSRDRQAFCILIKGDNLYDFTGSSIPGVVQARQKSFTKDGKWSHTVFGLRLAAGVRLVRGHAGWGTGLLAEGIATAIGTDHSLAALAAGLAVTPAALCAYAERRQAKSTVGLWLKELEDNALEKPRSEEHTSEL